MQARINIDYHRLHPLHCGMVHDVDIETVGCGSTWRALSISLRKHRHRACMFQSEDRETDRGTAAHECIQASGHVKELLLQVAHTIRPFAHLLTLALLATHTISRPRCSTISPRQIDQCGGNGRSMIDLHGTSTC
jgi:hypothetical protein